MGHQITRREEQTRPGTVEDSRIRTEESQTRPRAVEGVRIRADPVQWRQIRRRRINQATGGEYKVEDGRGQPDPDGSGPVEADPAAAGFGRSGGVLRSAANKRETDVSGRRTTGKRRKERETA